ncbi:ATP-binding protein [Enterobacter pasteurii]
MNGLEFESIRLRTGIDPNFLADTLTTDIELTDALFDLIDNSIDAARNEIVQGTFAKDEYGLPSSYKGYKIKLRFGDSCIIVEDNCIGIQEEVLENRAFFTGKRSNHEFGIGHYGLGLKRALLKAGTAYAMITDNGKNLYKSKFNLNSFATSDDNQLTAKKYPSSQRKRTIFIVTDLHSQVVTQIKDVEWMANTISELSIRYSNFIRKGLEITLVKSQKEKGDTFTITPSVPRLRQDGLMKVIKGELDAFTVKCDFRVGIHEDYTFPGEKAYDAKINKKLTKSYGIYYIFNDRVIVASSKETKHGFIPHWHSEYGGFICLAHVTGKDPKDLPWNTAKTEVKVNSPLFLQIRKRIEPLAQEYRKQAKVLINIWTQTKDLPDQERKIIFEKETVGKRLRDSELPAISNKIKNVKEQNIPLPAIKDGSDVLSDYNVTPVKLLKTNKESNKSVKNNKDRHTKDWSCLLPSYFPVAENDQVLNNLIIEATTLNVENAPHASCMLYRSLFEAAFKNFVKTNKLYSSVKDHYYEKGEGARKNHSEAHKKQMGIELSMCSSWLLDNDKLFPQDQKKRLALCSKKLKSHIPTMNGVVHGNQFIGNDGQIQKIRNETIYLLEFLTLCETAKL